MSFSFPKSVIDTLTKHIGEKATLRDQAIVKLYTCDFDGRWIYSNLCGILTLSIDRSMGGAVFFRMYDYETFELLFENELYYNFIGSFNKVDEGFYAYDVAQGYIGFAFSDNATAENFRKSINQLNKKMDEKELKKLHKEKFEKKEGIFAKITNFFGGSKPEKKQEISKPTNVQQNMSIKFDFEKGKFDLQSLSPEMKRIFKKAGIEKKDLLDKDFAPVLFEKILMELNHDAEAAPEDNRQTETSLQTSMAQNKSVPPPPNLNVPPPPPNINIPPPPNINIPPPPNLNIPKPPGINLAAPPKIEVNAPQDKGGESKTPAPVVKSEAGRGDLLAQIQKGVNLKKVNVDEKNTDKPMLSVKIDQNVEESLTMTLAKAILLRRQQITKNDNSSDEESPWTDSD